jgi:hypothetical protein
VVGHEVAGEIKSDTQVMRSRVHVFLQVMRSRGHAVSQVMRSRGHLVLQVMGREIKRLCCYGVI